MIKKNNILKKVSLPTITLGMLMGTLFLGSTAHADTINSSNNLHSENIKVNRADEDVTQIHNVTETINYVYEDGSQAAPTKTVTRSFSRVDIENKANRMIVNPGGGWNTRSQTFDAVPSPEISGYKANMNIVDPQTINPDSQNLIFTVIYTPLEERAEMSNTSNNNSSGAESNTNQKSENAVVTAADGKKGQLPQTGVKENSQLIGSIIGMMLTLISILGFSKKVEEKL
ncbi:mucin-binding protein [Lactobacillus sp. PV034]|uniref:mucin-binding protein n=1 Tax=Lactobacillus sp. PV034 TaxID=2594495 RepID=UPI002240ADC9|nr:LPXTG cell wall anchor domain-containing protein [Lactobacillus sp. PV034]